MERNVTSIEGNDFLIQLRRSETLVEKQMSIIQIRLGGSRTS